MILEDRLWERISPEQFELLCCELLRKIGFESVDHHGGTGDKGRDIVCWKSFHFAPDLTRRYKFVIQCKHTPKQIRRDKILEDLAKAVEHNCKFWWLITSAKLTANEKDWVASLPKDRYGFITEWIDRGLLELWLKLFPAVMIEYFPDAMSKPHKIQASAMQCMADQMYDRAIDILKRLTKASILATPTCLLAAIQSSQRLATRIHQPAWLNQLIS